MQLLDSARTIVLLLQGRHIEIALIEKNRLFFLGFFDYIGSSSKATVLT